MNRWTPDRLAKAGLVLFAPLEIARLLIGDAFPSCLVYMIWLGQMLVIVAAGWAAMAWPGRARVIRALSGLPFLMMLVWPWFNLFTWEVVGVPPATLEAGIDSDAYTAYASDELVEYTILNLISAPAATMESSVHGCAIPRGQKGELVIVSTIADETKTTILTVTVLVMIVGVTGAAVAAYHLFTLGHSAGDQAWVLAAVLVTLIIGGLLIAQSPAWLSAAGCAAPSTSRTAHRVEFWLGVRIHPFGPAMLVVALVMFWVWPRQAVRRAKRAAQMRLALQSTRQRPDAPA